MACTYLARKVELAINGFEVFDRAVGDELLVEPDLVVRRRPRQKVSADILGELVHLCMESGETGYRGSDDVPREHKSAKKFSRKAR